MHAGSRTRVQMRLYVSGGSHYTRSVLENVERTTRRYNPSHVDVEIRDAKDAHDSDRVFFTPMLVVRDVRDPDRKTIVVGDLREPDVLTTVLADHGVHAPQARKSSSPEQSVRQPWQQ